MNNNKREVFSANAKLTFSSVSVPVKFTTADGQTVDRLEPKRTLKGYPIVWNTLSTDRGGYKVRLAPGSATFTNPCLALYHHEFRDLLGNTANASLRILPADDYGIPVEIDLPNTTTANDVMALVADNTANGGLPPYLKGMSFSMVNGFEQSETSEENGQTVVTVTKFTCDEVTVTVIPAFAATSVEAFDTEEDDDDDTEPDKNVEYKSAAMKERKLNSWKLEKNRLDYLSF